MAYRADIEIAVKGAQELKRLQNEINSTSKLVKSLNDYIENFSGTGIVRSINTLRTAVAGAAAEFNKVALGTEEAVIAARKYVSATNELNAELRERAALLKTINEEERKNRLARAGIRESTQYGGPIGPGPASPIGSLVGQKSPVEERIRRTLAGRREQVQLEEALLRLEEKSAEQLNRQLQTRKELARTAALEVNTLIAKAAAGPQVAQLLLPAAAPGAPAMGGGARRRITGPVERLGGARTADEAAMALRFAQALQQQVKPLSQIDALYAGIAGEALKLQKIKALPSTEMLNATARGLQTIESIENRRFTTAQRRAQKLQQIQDYYGDTGMANAGYGAQGPAVPPAGIRRRTGTGVGAGFGNRAGGAISSAIIGGGFPLLFGQGPAAAVGGALGGAAGGILGGGFGFALSIAGTAIGDLITQSETLDKTLAALNSSLSATGSASITTASDVKQLAKDLNITNEEATQLVSTFSQFGDAQTREALASLFGGVGGAATFEAIARAGLDEKEALSSIFELRKVIGNEAATQLALQLNAVGATQTQAELLKLVVERSIQSSVATAKQVQFTDDLLSTWENIVSGVAGALSLAIQFIQKMREGSLLRLPFLDQLAALLGGVKARSGKQIAAERGADLEKRLRAEVAAARRAIQQETGALGVQSGLQQQMSAAGARKEDRTAQLKEELQALQQIGEAEDRIRDLRFQGREITALAAEQTRAIADIERDRDKAILSANNASEKALYIQIANQRIANLNLEIADKERDIRQRRFEEELRAQEAVRNSVKMFTDMRKDQELQLQYSKTYFRLVQEGMLPAEAERTANFEKLVTQQLNAVAEQIKITDLAILEAKARGLSTFELEKQLKIYKDQQAAIQGQATQGPGAGATSEERLREQIAKLRGELNELIDPVNQVITAAEGIGTAFANSFKGVISGAMTAQEALASFFQSVADRFLDMAAQIIAKWIEMTILNSVLNLFPGGGMGLGGATAAAGKLNPAVGFGVGPLGFRAAGGSVMAGSSYVVGERGPELFVPGRSGTIVPNNALGGEATNVVVNVDASGSSVQGNGNEANQLGKVIGLAVQQELIKQKRPGGLLA